MAGRAERGRASTLPSTEQHSGRRSASIRSLASCSRAGRRVFRHGVRMLSSQTPVFTSMNITSEALGALRADLRRVEITLGARIDSRVQPPNCCCVTKYATRFASSAKKLRDSVQKLLSNSITSWLTLLSGERLVRTRRGLLETSLAVTSLGGPAPEPGLAFRGGQRELHSLEHPAISPPGEQPEEQCPNTRPRFDGRTRGATS